MTSVDLFLSYQRSDGESVQNVRQILEARGVSTFFDRENLVAGLPWPQALEDALRSVRAVAVFVGRELGLWQKREMWFALDRQTQEERAGRSFPVIPVLLPGADLTPGFLFLNTWVDLRKDLTAADAMSQLLKTIRGEATSEVGDGVVALCPYQGLRAFREEYAGFFFGREDLSQRLLEIVHSDRGLVAVIGSSGSGKSSVVHSGLLPLLRRQRPPAATWDAVSFTPGNRPFRSLAAALIPLLEPEMTETDRLAQAQKLGDHLAGGDVQIEDVVKRIIKRSEGTDRLLVIADQFEEIFTQASETDRRPFVQSIVAALGRAPLEFVLTLRADFYGHVINLSRELSDRLEQSVVNVGSMTRDELETAIVKPAKKVGLDFEPGLVDRLLNDLGQEPGRLPLLEFALTELWERRRARLMTHAAYEEFGGVAAAISHRAQTEFAKFSPEQQASIRRIFTRLVRVAAPDEGGEDTRQRASLNELGPTARPFVDALTDARLLVTARDEVTGEETIEVSHEALIRGWSKLRAWLNEDREFLLWRQRLALSLTAWQRVNRDEGAFLHGALLREAERWQQSRAADLNEEEREFIGVSAALLQKERLEKERLRRSRVMMLAAGLVIALMLAGVAVLQWRRAVNVRQIALARSLLSRAVLIMDTQPLKFDRAVLLAIESLNLESTPEAESILRKALVLLPPEINRFQLECDVMNATFSPGGRFIACVDNKTGFVKIFLTAEGKESARLQIAEFPEISALAPSPDGKSLVIGFRSGGFKLFDTHTGQVLRSEGDGHRTTAVTFSPNGENFAAALFDGKSGLIIRMPSIATGGPQPYQIQHRIEGLTFSSDSRFLAALHQGSTNAEITIFDLTTGQRRTIVGGAATANLALSAGATWIALSHTDNTVRVIETNTGKDRSRLSHEMFARAVALSEAGTYAASGSDDGTAQVIEAGTGRRVALVPAGSPVRAAAFTTANSLVLLSEDGTVRTVDIVNKPAFQASQAPSGTILGISPRGRYFTTFSVSSAGASSLDLGVIDRATGRKLWQQVVPIELSEGVTRYSLDEKYLVAASRGCGMRVYEANTGKELLHKADAPGLVTQAISGDGKTVAWATAKFIEILHSDVSRQDTLKVSNTRLLELSPDGTVVAAGSEDPFLSVLEVATKKEIFRVQQGAPVTKAAFSSDGRYLVTSSANNTLILSEVSSRRVLWQSKNADVFTSLLFSHAGNVIAASGGRQPVVWLIDTTTGKTLSTIPIPREVEPVGAAFSVDDSYLDIADETSVTRHYLRHKDLIEQTCSVLTRNLAKDEWDTFMVAMPYGPTCPNLP
jgi:WD40 repeat protein